jgi:hypothetical protein
MTDLHPIYTYNYASVKNLKILNKTPSLDPKADYRKIASLYS